MIRRLARVTLAAGLIAVVILSLVPQQTVPLVDVSDKVKHFAAYMALALAAGFGFPERRSLFWVFLGLVAFGVFLEFLQALVPGRLAGADDALANTLGVFLGLALARFLQYRLRPL